MARISIKKSFKLLRKLPKSIPFGFKLLKDRRIDLSDKVIFVGITLGYLIFPYDLIFDVPFVGQFDDFAVFLFMFNWFVNRVPKAIRQEYGWKE